MPPAKQTSQPSGLASSFRCSSHSDPLDLTMAQTMQRPGIVSLGFCFVMTCFASSLIPFRTSLLIGMPFPRLS